MRATVLVLHLGDGLTLPIYRARPERPKAYGFHHALADTDGRWTFELVILGCGHAASHLLDRTTRQFIPLDVPDGHALNLELVIA